MRHEIRLNAIEAKLDDHQRRLEAAEGVVRAISPKMTVKPTQRQIARDFLKERLRGAPRMTTEILLAAQVAGISERTLRRAARDLGVVAYRGQSLVADRKAWAWRLPRGVWTEEQRAAPGGC
jgi:hypothetical protein